MGVQVRSAAAWVELIGRYGPWEWFGTFTFRGMVHPEAADKRFRYLCKRMNAALYGRHWFEHGQSVGWVRAMEKQRRDVIHYHALFRNVGNLKRLSVMDEWRQIAGFARVEVPRSPVSVACYVAKYVLKQAGGGEVDLEPYGFLKRHQADMYLPRGAGAGRLVRIDAVPGGA